MISDLHLIYSLERQCRQTSASTVEHTLSVMASVIRIAVYSIRSTHSVKQS